MSEEQNIVETEETRNIAPEEQGKPFFMQVAKFEKVSFDTFLNEFKPLWLAAAKASADENEPFSYNEEELKQTAQVLYDNIQLPRRATLGSAGYDFYFPFGYTELKPGMSIVIPTGIKVQMTAGWALKLYPRSGLGTKFRLQLDNTVGIIDADYYNNPKNEGMIGIKLTNDSRTGQTVCLDIGNAFCQGVFEIFGVTVDDEPVSEMRQGGFGSTDEHKETVQVEMPVAETDTVNKNGSQISSEKECNTESQVEFEANADHPTDDGCSEVATVDVTEAFPDGVDCAEPEH